MYVNHEQSAIQPTGRKPSDAKLTWPIEFFALIFVVEEPATSFITLSRLSVNSILVANAILRRIDGKARKGQAPSLLYRAWQAHPW